MVLALKSYEDKRLKLIARECYGKDLLDIGYAHMPNPYFKDKYVVGVDLESPAHPGQYDEELVGDATKLGPEFESRKFDTVVASELIEHLEQPYDFLRDIRKHLKDDGTLIITTPNPIGWPCLIFEWFKARRFFYTKGHLYYFPPRWMERMLTASGYKVVKTKGVGFWAPLFTIPLPATLSYQVIYVAKKSSD